MRREAAILCRESPPLRSRERPNLRAGLKHLMVGDIRTRGEFQLTDALQMMIEQGCKFRTAPPSTREIPFTMPG